MDAMNAQKEPLLTKTPTPARNNTTYDSRFSSVKNKTGEIWVATNMVQGDCFALQVMGDGMMDENIHDGDFVIVRRQPIAASGDIIISTLKNETTIRKLYISRNIIELRPANATRRPTVVKQNDDLRIWGKVVGVCRREADSQTASAQLPSEDL